VGVVIALGWMVGGIGGVELVRAEEPGAGGTAVAAPAAPAGWRLVWADEFEGEGAMDAAKWGYEEGFVRNREAQYYTKDRRENARVEGGRLIIEARLEQYPNPGHKAGSKDWRSGPEHAKYTSASVITRDKAAFMYGRIEVRAKLPAGRGNWPAIWMLGESKSEVGWPACGEIDIMEYVGHKPGVVHANIHTKKYNHSIGTGKGDKLEGVEPTKDFHLYAIEWFEDRIDFFFDNRKYFTYRKEAGAGEDAWPFDKPCYLLLNLAIGGAWGGQKGIDDAAFPQRMEVDYVRVYERVKE
jgi:beta-glucanase (GH16 family)